MEKGRERRQPNGRVRWRKQMEGLKKGRGGGGSEGRRSRSGSWRRRRRKGKSRRMKEAYKIEN